MAVSDARRLEVYEQARAQWGDGPAEALMEMVVPAGQDMATRQDVERSIAALRAEMQAEIAKLRAEMVDRFAKVEARLAALEERSKHLSTRTFVLASHVPTYALIIGLYFR
jgi:phage host-nuclease inhibitor protein Gam